MKKKNTSNELLKDAVYGAFMFVFGIAIYTVFIVGTFNVIDKAFGSYICNSEGFEGP